MEPERVEAREAQAARFCAICMTAVTADEAAHACPACGARYHAECWEDNGGCAVYGCSQVPKTEGLTALEVPPAFWGREDKSCPQCGQTILAMAVRCRHCGAALGDEPEAKGAYMRRLGRQKRAPMLRRVAVLNMVAALLPGLAIVAVIAGGLFYNRHQKDIKRLPGTYESLYRISIAVGLAQSVILAIAVTAFWIKDMVS